MSDNTLCQVCSAPRVPHLGLYCRACYNRAAYIRQHGSDEGYKPYNKRTDTCANCDRAVKQRHPNFRSLCHACGVKKHGAYQQARRQAHKPNNPIIVAPKTHRAKGQDMAPPAPRVEVKPVPVDVTGLDIPRVLCPFGRFEGRDELELKFKEWGEEA